MIKKVTAVIISSLLLLCGCSSEQSGKIEYDKNTSMTAMEVSRLMGIGINLGNTMEAYDATNCEQSAYEWMPIVGNNTPKDYETRWGALETTQKIIDGMKSEGFNTVRIPVYWGNMMENDGKWTIDPDYIKRVGEIVDYCDKAGLFVVVNCHHFDEFIIRRNSLEECKAIFSTVWTQIAEYFKDYSYNLVFEGFNEYLGGSQFDESGNLADPGEKAGFELTNALNQVFVDAVRATGSNNADRVLIVSGYNTNIDRTTSFRFQMPTDTVKDRLMVSVHYVDNAVYWSRAIGGQWWLDYTDAQCKLLTDAFTSKNIPVFLGETTSYYPPENFASDAIYHSSAECMEIVLNKLRENGFTPVLWDVSNGFYSRSDCRISDNDNRNVIKRVSKAEEKEAREFLSKK